MILLRIFLIGIVLSYAKGANHQQELIQAYSLLYFIYAGISFMLSLFAGLCSGMTVGYMSISKQEMELWMNSQSQQQRKISKIILQILENHHLLLSTLLLSNALALQALPIFLDKILPGYLAIIISTAAVVIFGQVLPQAYCTGPNKIVIGYYLAPVVKFLQFILYIFVAPITYALDRWLGHHEQKIILNKQNLKALLYLHNKKQYGYRPQQIQILQNTLDLRTIQLNSCMIPLQKVLIIQQNTPVNQKLIDQLMKTNFSKIPIYRKQKDNIIGFIKVKNLLKFNIHQQKTIKQGLIIQSALIMNTKDTLLNAIDSLKSKKSNFAIITGENNKCKGIITLKQVFQKIILKQFNDDDIRTQFNWNRINYMPLLIQAKQQD